MQEWISDNTRLLAALAAVVLAALAIVYGREFFGGDILERAAARVAALGAFGQVAYVALFTLCTVLPVTVVPLVVVGTAVFGFVKGTMLSWLGALLGACVAFSIARRLGRDSLGAKLKTRFPQLHDFDGRLENKGVRTTLFLRLVPLISFNALNYALGLTRLSFSDYFIATAVGIIPGTFIYAYFIYSALSQNIVRAVYGAVALAAWIVILYLLRRRYRGTS